MSTLADQFDPNSGDLLQKVQKELTLSALCGYLASEASGNFRAECRRLETQLTRQSQQEQWAAQRPGPDQAKHETAAENLRAAVAWLNSGLDEGDFSSLIWSVLGRK